MKQRIERKLTAAFQPARLTVVDESGLHAGHAGARPGGESHFRVEMEAAAFAGKSRLDCQRAVYATLAEELQAEIHALALTLSAPKG